MALTTPVPTSDGTTTNFGTLFPTTPTTHFDKVDEGVPGNDATDYIESTANSSVSDFFEMSDMPGDFGDAIDFAPSMRSEISGSVDDSIFTRVGVYESNETTLVGVFVFLGNDHSWTTTAGGTQSDTSNKATWDGRKLYAEAFRNNTGMPDAVTIRITAIDVDINYDVAAGGDGTDIPWPEGLQPRQRSVKVVASGPGQGLGRS